MNVAVPESGSYDETLAIENDGRRRSLYRGGWADSSNKAIVYENRPVSDGWGGWRGMNFGVDQCEVGGKAGNVQQQYGSEKEESVSHSHGTSIRI